MLPLTLTGTEDDELTVVRESSLPRQSTIDSEVQDIGKSQKFCPKKDILDADDIEVMRDAPRKSPFNT